MLAHHPHLLPFLVHTVDISKREAKSLIIMQTKQNNVKLMPIDVKECAADQTGLLTEPVDYYLFSSAVPSGSGAFLMPSCPSSVCPSVRLSVCPSRLRGGGANLRNASVTFSLFWHEASLG